MSIRRTLAAAAACFVVGCADFRGFCDTQLLASRNAYMAQMAFNDRGVGLCEGRKHFKHFRKGFHSGYYSVASGEGGVAPLVPPDEYWASCYQDADGLEMINDWFAGFNEGAFAASQDGIGQLSELPTWAGGQCCDDNDRFNVRRDLEHREGVGPKKPRRGDPPVRAKLPPPMPKDVPPVNTEGGKEQPLDPTIEMPLPSEAEEKDSIFPKKSTKEPPAKSPPAKEKTAQLRTWKKTAPIVEIKPKETPALTPPTDRWTRREMPKATPVKSTTTASVAPPVRAESTKTTNRDALIPVNPFLKTKPEPNYPLAPPMLPSVGMKVAPAVEPPVQKVAQVVKQPAPRNVPVVEGSGEPPPPAPAKPLERMEAKRPLLDSALKATSHTAPAVKVQAADALDRLLTTPQSDVWRRAAAPPPTTPATSEPAKPAPPPKPAEAPKTEMKPAAKPEARPPVRIDEWETPHDESGRPRKGRTQ
jgi:hypothetical protein